MVGGLLILCCFPIRCSHAAIQGRCHSCRSYYAPTQPCGFVRFVQRPFETEVGSNAETRADPTNGQSGNSAEMAASSAVQRGSYLTVSVQLKAHHSSSNTTLEVTSGDGLQYSSSVPRNVALLHVFAGMSPAIAHVSSMKR